MTIFDVILLVNTLGITNPVDPTKGVDFYYTRFQPKHAECVNISNDLMLCPTNVDRKISPSSQIDREVMAWGLPADCDHISDNVSLCKK